MPYKDIERMLYMLAARAMPRFTAVDPTMEIGELVGQFGLVYTRCAAGFNPDKGIKFTTYLAQSCWWEVNRMVENLEKERRVVSTASVDSFGEEGEDGNLRDKLFSAQEPSREEVLMERQEFHARIQSLSVDARRVVALLLYPSAKLKAFCAQRRPVGEGGEETPVDLICQFLGIPLARALELRLEFRAVSGAEFTRINPRAYGR